jgi:hypothetical protein
MSKQTVLDNMSNKQTGMNDMGDQTLKYWDGSEIPEADKPDAEFFMSEREYLEAIAAYEAAGHGSERSPEYRAIKSAFFRMLDAHAKGGGYQRNAALTRVHPLLWWRRTWRYECLTQ